MISEGKTAEKFFLTSASVTNNQFDFLKEDSSIRKTFMNEMINKKRFQKLEVLTNAALSARSTISFRVRLQQW